MVDALFDKRRRERLRDAMKKGRLAAELRARLPEPALDTAPTQLYKREPARPAPVTPPPLPAYKQQSREDSGFISFGDKPDRPSSDLDISLFDAIKAGNLRQVIAAIKSGANINARLVHVPSHRRGDAIMMANVSPLQYAISKGNQDIVRLLEGIGAKD